ncbi:MAG: hypothetical protein JOY82_18155 [Streptosporangiaceae bacterium]|nr:hypothetical protein [Streptosporangiaceae bacterium]
MTCRDMVRGLLTELEDHNCWTMGEAAGTRVRTGCSTCSPVPVSMSSEMLGTAADWAAGHLAAGHDGGDAVLIVDETAEPRCDQPHRDAWALWRRRHQYQAQQAHQRWPPTPTSHHDNDTATAVKDGQSAF